MFRVLTDILTGAKCMFFAVFCRKNAQFLHPIVGKVLNRNLLLKNWRKCRLIYNLVGVLGLEPRTLRV